MRTYEEFLILEAQAQRRRFYATQHADDETIIATGAVLRELLTKELARKGIPASAAAFVELVDQLESERLKR